MTMTTHNPKELLLQAKGLQAWYGAAQILYDVDPVSYTHLTLPTTPYV